MLAFRRLPDLVAPGPEQMARDEALLETAANHGVASFRFYRWSEPTWSLGYFQAAAERGGRKPDAWVRRSSGGAGILHHAPHELTYSIALPANAAILPKGESWICHVHHALCDYLNSLGIPARAVVCGEEKKLGEFLCFLHHTPGDLAVEGSKVVGSAQRKLRGAILQHGTILLSRSPFTPELPGIAELAGRLHDEEHLKAGFLRELTRQFGWRFEPGAWSAEEEESARRIEAEKYRAREWNERR
jgi:lipoyl(octanoyl) transferase